MKIIFVTLVMALSTVTAHATEAEGGTGLSRPGEYYNPDYKCSVKNGLTLYLNVQPTFELSATTYNSRSNRVRTVYLALYPVTQDFGLFQIEPALDDYDVSFLDTNRGVRVLNANREFVTECEQLGHPVNENGPYFP